TIGCVKWRRHCGLKNRPWKVELATVRTLGSRAVAQLAKAWLRSTPPEKARGSLAARARGADGGTARLARFRGSIPWWGATSGGGAAVRLPPPAAAHAVRPSAP